MTARMPPPILLLVVAFLVAPAVSSTPNLSTLGIPHTVLSATSTSTGAVGTGAPTCLESVCHSSEMFGYSLRDR